MRAYFLALLLLLNIPSYAAADSANEQAKDFVTQLFQDFQEIYNPTEANPKQALLDYYQQHFDHELIARFVLGGYGRRASEQQRTRFSELLPQFILAQISPQIGPYFAEDSASNNITVLAVQPMKKQHMMVQTAYKGAKSIEINVRLRPINNTLKVLDVQVAGISMLLAQRDLIASMIKQNSGDLDAFLEQLAQKV